MTSTLIGWTKELFDSLPEAGGAAREEAILEAVRAGRIAPVTWVELKSEHKGHNAIFFVSADALRVGDEGSSVRVNVSARTMQKIADILDCVLPTSHICNLIWDQAAVRVSPSLQKPDAQMSATSRMLQHHEAIEKKQAGRPGLIESIGKHWVLSNRLAGTRDRSANYGWYDSAATHSEGGRKLWQPVGLAHNLDHVDYSQVVRLVQQRCVVDGAERDIRDAMVDRELCGLVSSEGPLKLVRLPGV